ncbi:competence/damage-inducible protein A [Halanaerobiaceae bacterium Z-7014]|uniref:Putative competence-damage inducible protein n=1 Tax=Halonatronomonas betaini TaxID=2778430 RepID=A0A931AZL2_9FIRM|nr:competence/damage-inducible protein A [Halonatronomonas betaini]MBF8437678.1 competence/damage-inducible protein A [Halonatronomonas betaini]
MDDIAVLSVGDELLFGEIDNTNASWIAERLFDNGCQVNEIITVPDKVDVIASKVERLLSEYKNIIITGGLGPTQDDITRDGVARATGQELIYRPELADNIKSFFNEIGKEVTENNYRQAYLPADAEPILNEEGTAPGFYLVAEGSNIFVLPGVPVEMKRMIDNFVLDRVCQPRQKNSYDLTLRVAGIGEAALEDRIKDIINRSEGIAFRFLPHGGEISIKLSLRPGFDPDNFAKVVAEIKEELGYYIYGEGDKSLAGVVSDLLRENNFSLALAESCTGGLIAKRLTDIPGASDFFKGGVIVYSNASKVRLLGLAEEILEKEGAVSRLAADQMATGVKELFDADFGVSVTGIAGPGGGTDEKPVGLVYSTICSNSCEFQERWSFSGDRKKVRWYASQYILNKLRLAILEAIK